MLSSSNNSLAFDVLLEIALDLTASLAASDRYGRLIAGVRRLIPCDAACLLRLEGTHLVPVAGFGLSGRALARRYDRREHPRLDVILRSRKPVRFPAEQPAAGSVRRRDRGRARRAARRARPRPRVPRLPVDRRAARSWARSRRMRSSRTASTRSTKPCWRCSARWRARRCERPR